MNVRLRNDFYLKSAVWYDDSFKINNYTISCDFITVSDRSQDHIVALDRINYLFDFCNDACFINQNQTKKIRSLKSCNIKVIDLPQEPVDQIVGLVLFYKINAICEQKFLCTDLDISSELGSNIHYLHSDHERTAAVPDTGWWHDSSPNFHVITRQPNKKIVKFPVMDNWQNLDLFWFPEEIRSASIHKLPTSA
jgi:hypothetical protein